MKVIGTSTGPAEIVTDAGPCYLKALGNKEGPHALAADWVGTALADWFGLATFAVAKLVIQQDDEIALGHSRKALPGTAIAFRSEGGSPWGGTLDELKATINTDDISRLIVFDTWVRNCDRHPPDLTMRKPNRDNVFLSTEEAPSGKFVLKAIDHTHCFNCGRKLGSKLSTIDLVKDPRVYGQFPEFGSFIDRSVVEKGVDRLARLQRSFVEELVAEIAPDWKVADSGRRALTSLIVDRADFVCGTIVESLFQTGTIERDV